MSHKYGTTNILSQSNANCKCSFLAAGSFSFREDAQHAEDTIEDFVLDILDRKLNMFELVIGEVDMILGQMGDERDFEEIVLEIWAQAQSQDDLRQGMAGLGDDLVKARAAYQHAQAYDEALFGEDFSAE